MKLFESTRIRLTAWYLLIIAFVCVSFSAIIYRDITWELERGFSMAEAKIENQPFPILSKQRAMVYLASELTTAKKTLLLRLMLVNSIVLVVSGVGGYFLAGKTLQPIKQALEDQKRFVADASHELRTPLTSLKTEIEVALRNKKLKLRDAVNILNSNLDEVDKMKNFTDYLLTLSKYESNNDASKEKVDLGEAARQGVERNKTIAKKRKIKIVENLGEVTTYGSPQGLVELISILVNNAIKYSKSGDSVFVSVNKAGRRAVVEVRDLGMGIESSDLPHIFDRFYRADLSRSKEDVDGFGLGLSIAKSIVDTHKGTIGVKSSLGNGSKFIVSLPMS